MKVRPENVRAARLGNGANCSSIGSVVDTLFVSAAVGGAVLAAVCAALAAEKDIRIVGGSTGASPPASTPARDGDDEAEER
jgi:uncharacterized NAD-dependent epimerase/dehydratase family protein